MRGIRFFKSAGVWRHLRLTILALPFLIVAYPDNSAFAQKQKPPSSQLERKLDEQSQEPPDDVVRIRTDLVQTSVAVFDKRGKFVDNLRPEDFELRIDGKPYPVLFFDRVINGVAGESLQAAPPNNAGLPITRRTDATRAVLFFVDDLHLSPESTSRTRRMLSNYIEQEMGANDQAVIASASGQIGFLQQVTGKREVLRAAVDRLKYRPLNLMDTERPRMSVYQALAIGRNDADVLKYFADVLLNDILRAQARVNPAMARNAAERMTRNRAGRLTRQSDIVAKQTLTALDSAVRSSAQLSGRKLFVFLSDGFLVNNLNPDVRYRLQRITDAAVRAGAVVYTIQASGLNTSFPDASSDAMLIPGTGTGSVTGEDIAAQDPLTELAADTGGHALLNANDLNGSVKRALRESNDYYLLAWRPETEGFRGKDFHRIEVSVKGHSDLSVLVQRGFFSDDKAAPLVRAESPQVAAMGSRPSVGAAVTGALPNGRSTTPERFPHEELAAAIRGKLSNRTLPTSLTANYLDVPNRGASLSILMQVENKNAEPRSDQPATVDVGGIIYNDSGKVAGSFTDTLKPDKNAGEAQHITYLTQVELKPGLYQVRVAARDANGSTGVATDWVRIPDLASHRLSLSSLLIGERDITNSVKKSDAVEFQKAQLKIDKRFLQGSRLRFLTFVYNAARERAGQSPQLEVRVELFHNNRAVVSTPALAIETKGVDDPARIPYAGEFNLALMPKGHYLLRVTVTDRSAKTNASQETAFAIE